MKKKLEIKRTAHYHIQEGKDTKRILYIIHGYGQLASEFLDEFEFLKDSSVTVIAPEAISKFYNKERKAVANWMSSHEREDEIEDYIQYLDTLQKKIEDDYEAVEYSILAFSQGTSTALRWMQHSHVDFKTAYICSGSVPPEIEKGDLKHHGDCQFIYAYGNDDRLIEEDKAKALIDRFTELVEQLEVVQFNGGHIISQTTKDMLSKDFN